MNSLLVKAVIAVSAAIVAGTAVHLVHQSQTKRLLEQNRALLAQQAALAKEQADAAAALTDRTSELQNLQNEKSELLRLRGEVGRLRNQTKELESLRQRNRQLEAALAKAGQAVGGNEADEDNDPNTQTAQKKMNQAKQLVLALLMYADDNEHQLPTALNQTANYLGGADNFLSLTNHFELVLQGPINAVTNPANTIAVRETDPTLIDGAWFKTYGFADGHSEFHREPTADGFAAWEAQRMMPPPASGP